MEKSCSGPCKQTKPVEGFSKSSRAKDGRQAWCKECKKIRQQELPKRIDPKKQRASTLKHLYGLTVEQWDQMLIAQSGLCALCNTPMRSPHVDHSHDSGVVRGLLCLGCNTMLGHVERLGLLRIEEYLRPKTSPILQPLPKDSFRNSEALYRSFLLSSYT